MLGSYTLTTKVRGLVKRARVSRERDGKQFAHTVRRDEKDCVAHKLPDDNGCVDW